MHLNFHASFGFSVMTMYFLVGVSARCASVSANFSVLAVNLMMSFSAGGAIVKVLY